MPEWIELTTKDGAENPMPVSVKVAAIDSFYPFLSGRSRSVVFTAARLDGIKVRESYSEIKALLGLNR